VLADLDRGAGIGAGQPFEAASGEPAAREARQAGGGHRPVLPAGGHGAVALESRVVEIDAAAGVADDRVADALVDPTLVLVQSVGKPAELGAEGGVAPRHLADRRLAEHHPVGDVRPVTERQRHLGVVPQAERQVRRVDAAGRQRPLDLLGVDGKPEAGADIGAEKARFRLVVDAAEGERVVVVGEAEHGAVGERHRPAAGEGRCATVEGGLDARWKGFHSCIPCRACGAPRLFWSNPGPAFGRPRLLFMASAAP